MRISNVEEAKGKRGSEGDRGMFRKIQDLEQTLPMDSIGFENRWL
ncbi:MAG: hypothetical protein ACYS9C_02370 [Planctomycetota bacterium]|jgi:hypothetical protein